MRFEDFNPGKPCFWVFLWLWNMSGAESLRAEIRECRECGWTVWALIIWARSIEVTAKKLKWNFSSTSLWHAHFYWCSEWIDFVGEGYLFWRSRGFSTKGSNFCKFSIHPRPNDIELRVTQRLCVQRDKLASLRIDGLQKNNKKKQLWNFFSFGMHCFSWKIICQPLLVCMWVSLCLHTYLCSHHLDQRNLQNNTKEDISTTKQKLAQNAPHDLVQNLTKGNKSYRQCHFFKYIFMS